MSFTLLGDLGAGKTTLTRSIIRSKCGDSEMRVTSPSYLLDNVYEFGDDYQHTIHHMDLYRLQPNSDLSYLRIPEIYSSSLCIIEWPERLKTNDFPKEYLELSIHIQGSTQSRTIVATLAGDRWIKKRVELESLLK